MPRCFTPVPGNWHQPAPIIMSTATDSLLHKSWAKHATRLSFASFLEYAHQEAEKRQGMKSVIFRHIYSKLSRIPVFNKPITDLSELKGYEEELEQIASTVFPLADMEENSLCALSVPLSPKFFYLSDALKRLLPHTAIQPEKMVAGLDLSSLELRRDEVLYQKILEQYYQLRTTQLVEMVFPFFDNKIGITRYFRIIPDMRFTTIRYNGILPACDENRLLDETTGKVNIAYLRENMPLENLEAEGFAIIRIREVTSLQAVELIKNTLLNIDYLSSHQVYDNISESLHTILCNTNLDIGLLPVLRLNERFVVDNRLARYSILARHGIVAEKDAGSKYSSFIPFYAARPFPIVVEDMRMVNREGMEALLKAAGINSYMALPIRHQNKLVGALELGSVEPKSISPMQIAQLQDVIPLLGQLFDQYVKDYEAQITRVIKEKFTSLQPAVEWRFREAAWKYLNDSANEPDAQIEKLSFEEVYPFYGAIDIRDSSVKRLEALQADTKVHLDILLDLFDSLSSQLNLALIDELQFKANRWKTVLQKTLLAEEEVLVNVFLDNEVRDFLWHFRQHHNQVVQDLVANYFECLDYESGCIFANRRRFEAAMQDINNMVLGYLDKEKQVLQQSFPLYFEQYRTDGVEYNIYTGQSLSPDIPFDQLYLRNLRLWQLNSMVHLAREARKMQEGKVFPLETTQLILAHHLPIAITFRRDERRFDVEGASNIRYEVMKKRLDKVLVNETGERLTQPGKIAIVYSNAREADEYGKFVHYLIDKGLLKGELEYLGLEETQGFLGLKALRVSIA